MEKDKSQRVSIKSDQNPRDFIICTDSNDYDSLSDGPFNIVLQNIFLIMMMDPFLGSPKKRS